MNRNAPLIAKPTLLIAIAFSSWIFVQAQAPSPAAPFVTGLNFPVSLKFTPDGRVFFNEKDTGDVRVILSNGTLLGSAFATISPLYVAGESGLLGIALDPNFSLNGYVYVYFTYSDSQSFTHGHIRRYTATGNTGTNPFDVFDVVSSAPGTMYHNGGYIKFGPDGKLYAQVGEFHQDPQAQNMSSTNGKMLRMNPDGSVPPDNPFPGSLVYASGIRNAFGFDFDPSNSRLIATEAGPSSDDEINVIVKGGNYGWPNCLGICHDPRYTDPIAVFNRVVTPTGIATAAPNVYYFGEWNTGDLVRLELNSSGSPVSMNQVYTQPGGIVAVEMGPDGRLYFTSPDGIYTYNLRVGASTTTFDPTPILVAGAAVAGLLVSLAFQYRRKRTTRIRVPIV
jgi:aldose sugar dehydrogenase